MFKLIKNISNFYPFYKGRGRLALSKIGRKDDENLCLETLKTGQYIYVYPNDYIGRMIIFFGDLDPSISYFIKRNIKSGDVVVDVGANLGIVTLQVASIVGPEGKVISFEPNKHIVDALVKSIEYNSFNNIQIINKALSDQDGIMKLLIPPQGFGQAKISDEGNVTCEVMQLDNFVIDDTSSIRLMKIDVEGHESKVLKGGLNFIKHYSPELILFESHKSQGAFWQREEVQLLEGLGYNFFELKRVFLQAKLFRLTKNTNYKPDSYDFVAIKPDAKFQ